MEEQSSILDRIVSITESRDVEILEISLLRTIYEVVPCRAVYFIKTAEREKLIQAVSCYGEPGYNSSCELCDVFFCTEGNFLSESVLSSCDEHKAVVSGELSHPYTVCPVDVMNRNIGYIVLDGADTSGPDLKVLESLVRIYQNYVSVLLDNQRDTLTGLLNRKTFDDRIMKLVELQKKQNKSDSVSDGERRKNGGGERFWLGIFDIDDFKKINDSFGHVYGDEILILISRIVQDVFRTTDMKFRFGGEEFIVVIKSGNRETAFSVFERFRERVENYRFPQTGKVTVSIGIVEITGEETSSVFVGCADSALYYAKGNGKNQTCVYQDLVEKGLIEPERIRKGGVILFDD